MMAVAGLLDFGEVMQGGAIGTDVWFALLNLGMRVSPASGTDYPYIDHPGAVRSYVKVDDGFDVDAWFDGLAAGRTFVTNGPLLEFDINGTSIGGELRVERGDPLEIAGRASINPDLGVLERLELIRFGDVVASGTDRLEHRAVADESGWYVLSASATKPRVRGIHWRHDRPDLRDRRRQRAHLEPRSRA